MKVIQNIKKETITIQDDKCWLCGKKFNKEVRKDRRTYHHAFPQRYNSIINLKVPICQGCHDEINKEDAIYKRAYNSLKGHFLTIEGNLAKRLPKIQKWK